MIVHFSHQTNVRIISKNDTSRSLFCKFIAAARCLMSLYYSAFTDGLCLCTTTRTLKDLYSNNIFKHNSGKQKKNPSLTAYRILQPLEELPTFLFKL